MTNCSYTYVHIRIIVRSCGDWTSAQETRQDADVAHTSTSRTPRAMTARLLCARSLAIASRIAAAPLAAASSSRPRVLAPPPSALRARASSSSTSTSTSTSTTTTPSRQIPPWDASAATWDVRVLYDGDCPLCVREVNFLRAKDAGRGRLDLVDIASATYDPAANRGIDFETAMSTIHGVTPEGDVITGIEVFKRAYEAVGLGYVYAFTSVPWLARAADAAYDFWAGKRLAVTGRASMAEVRDARERRMRAERAAAEGGTGAGAGASACAAEKKSASASAAAANDGRRS